MTQPTTDTSREAMLREAEMMDASSNHVWAEKTRALVAERDTLRDQLAAARSAAKLGLDMARANDLPKTAETISDALKSTTPAPKASDSECPSCGEYDCGECECECDPAPREVTVQEAYLAGFMAAGEGYNGEYPFQDNDASPEGCDMWVKQRDEDLRALANEEQSDG